MFLTPSDLLFVAVLQNLSNYFGDYSVIITYRTEDQSYENKIQVVINHIFRLSKYIKIMIYNHDRDIHI